MAPLSCAWRWACAFSRPREGASCARFRAASHPTAERCGVVRRGRPFASEGAPRSPRAARSLCHRPKTRLSRARPSSESTLSLRGAPRARAGAARRRCTPMALLCWRFTGEIGTRPRVAARLRSARSRGAPRPGGLGTPAASRRNAVAIAGCLRRSRIETLRSTRRASASRLRLRPRATRAPRRGRRSLVAPRR